MTPTQSPTRGPHGGDALQAIAEPRRRAILEVLCRGERSVGEIVDQVGVSQPAVSQHLKVLAEAGLVDMRREGRRRFYRASPGGLQEARAILEQFWSAALAQMKDDIERPRDR